MYATQFQRPTSTVDFNTPQRVFNNTMPSEYPLNTMEASRPVFNNSMPTIPQTDYPRCEHGAPSCCSVTKKNGPNFGRPFFRCGMDYPNACNFFQWVHPTEEEISKTERFAKRKAEEKNNNLSQQAFQTYIQQQLELLMKRQEEMMNFMKKLDEHNGILNKKIHEFGKMLEWNMEEEVEEEAPSKKKKTNVSYN